MCFSFPEDVRKYLKIGWYFYIPRVYPLAAGEHVKVFGFFLLLQVNADRVR
jgi:hypothetical protein